MEWGHTGEKHNSGRTEGSRDSWGGDLFFVLPLWPPSLTSASKSVEVEALGRITGADFGPSWFQPHSRIVKTPQSLGLPSLGTEGKRKRGVGEDNERRGRVFKLYLQTVVCGSHVPGWLRAGKATNWSLWAHRLRKV